MTVSSTTNRKTFTGDGATTSFGTSPVVFFETTDLVVYVVTTATGASTTLTENTDYTVSGGDGSTGTVSLAGGSAPYGAPSSAQTLVIVRDVALTQETDLVENDINSAEVQEDALDKLTMIVQQHDASIERTMRLSDSDVSGADLTIPSASTRASKFLAFDSDGELTVSATTAATIAVSAAMQPVVEAATLAAARSAMDVPSYKMVGRDLDNACLGVSMAANAVTLSLLGANGSVLSAANAAKIAFRSASAAVGSSSTVTTSSATSVAISSGSTGGSSSGFASRIWVAAILTGGAVELAWYNACSLVEILPFDEGSVISTTAEGGAGGADTAGVWYSTTARSSVPFTILGYFDSTQATAGTWATPPTRVVTNPKNRPGDVIQRARNTTAAVVACSTALPIDDTIPAAAEGTQILTRAITPKSGANLLRVEVAAFGCAGAADIIVGAAINRDSAAAVKAVLTDSGANGAFNLVLNYQTPANQETSTTFNIRMGSAATTIHLNAFATAGTRAFGGVGASEMIITEISA